MLLLDELRLGPLKDERLELLLDELRLGPLKDERLELLLDELRLGPLKDERLELLDELRLELPLNELRLDELPDERLLLIDELWLPPPPRLPPLRCAKAGAALSARPTITRAITFEVFIFLLLSLFIVFSILLSLPHSHILVFFF